MLRIVEDGGVSRFDDLHIDKISSEWKHKDRWISGGLEALRIAIGLRDRHQLPFTVGLGFSLESGHQRGGIDFQTKEELFARLDWSPPSLYLFRRGTEPHAQTADATVEELDATILGAESVLGCCYLEFRAGGAGEYYRSVFAEG